MSFRLLATTCVDGDCPSVWVDDETGGYRFRSRDEQDPTRERDILYTAEEMATLRRTLGW